MAKKMLIDATHPEETRVVVVDGNKVDDFDFESINKRQLAGNIYLAKVTRVEPSLQAAFVEYGGNRHGFLAFAEIHPDYYQIPVADREALLAEEAAEEEAAQKAEEAHRGDAEDGEGRGKSKGRSRRRSRKGESAAKAESSGKRNGNEVRGLEVIDPVSDEETVSADISGLEIAEEPRDAAPEDSAPGGAPAGPGADNGGPLRTMSESVGLGDDSVSGDVETSPRRDEDEAASPADEEDRAGKRGTVEDGRASGGGEPRAEADDRAEAEAAPSGSSTGSAELVIDAPADAWAEPVENRAAPAEDHGSAGVGTAPAEDDAEDADEATAEQVGPDEKAPSRQKSSRSRRRRKSAKQDETKSDADEASARATPTEDDDEPEARDAPVDEVGAEDVREEAAEARRIRRRRYKIQDVVKVRQIMLVQVVKEERGNKGAALTTYLSLAGRYCVLMPNTARGGGISRKITNATDRKRLREIVSELDVPQGMGLIVRTAGAERTRAEIKRDYEFLLRQWEQVRDLTLKSVAPTLIYEEGSLIKRAIRDYYSKEIDAILVEGEAGYREAKDYMKMLMPSHAKNVQQYAEQIPLFIRYQVESYLNAMFNPTVQLKSGGYIVIGITEALVAIDVNSGRSTKEGSIEDTALKTNLEAADEVARQLRLRDLAGLIVIDFIDMEESRNNRAVEKRMKERLKTDRARIQLGRISAFGLMEMSRQRLRPGMLEATTQPCPHCMGQGLIRSDESLALSILRELEEEGVRGRSAEVTLSAPVGIVNFLVNHKRAHLAQIEERYGMVILLMGDPALSSPNYVIDRSRTASRPVLASEGPVVRAGAAALPEPEEEEESAPPAEPQVAEPETSEEDDRGDQSRQRRRRGKRGGRRRRGRADGAPETQPDGERQDAGEDASSETGGDEEGRSRRRKRRSRRDSAGEAQEAQAEAPADTDSETGSVTGEAAEESAAERESEPEAAAAEPELTETAQIAEEAAPTAEAPEPAEPELASEAPDPTPDEQTGRAATPEADVEPPLAALAEIEEEAATVDEAALEVKSYTAQAPSADAPAEHLEATDEPESDAAEAPAEPEPEQQEQDRPKRRGWWMLR